MSLPEFKYDSSDARVRLDLAKQVMMPWAESLRVMLYRLTRYEASINPDNALSGLLYDLIQTHNIDAAQTLLPLIGERDVNSYFVLAANHNLFEGVALLLPRIHNTYCFDAAMLSYLNVTKPRDERIFDLLLPKVNHNCAQGNYLVSAIRSGHMDLARRLIPHHKPWEIAKRYSKDPDVLQSLDQLWAQSLEMGVEQLHPITVKKDRSAQYWSKRLPTVASYLRSEKLLNIAKRQEVQLPSDSPKMRMKF